MKYVEEHGEISLVVAWIHSNQKMILDLVFLENKSGGYELYHLLSSRQNAGGIRNEIDPDESISYHQIQLGFKIENGVSRWLTNEEIAAAVIKSIISKQDIMVGQIQPLDKAPRR